MYPQKEEQQGEKVFESSREMKRSFFVKIGGCCYFQRLWHAQVSGGKKPENRLIFKVNDGNKRITRHVPLTKEENGLFIFTSFYRIKRKFLN